MTTHSCSKTSNTSCIIWNTNSPTSTNWITEKIVGNIESTLNSSDLLNCLSDSDESTKKYELLKNAWIVNETDLLELQYIIINASIEKLDLIINYAWIKNISDLLELEGILINGLFDNLELFVKYYEITNKDTLLKLENLIKYFNYDNLNDNLEILSNHWFDEINDFIDLQNIIIWAYSMNLISVLKILNNYWIKNKEDLVSFQWIIINGERNNVNNILKIFTSNRITNIDDLAKFQDTFIHSKSDELNSSLELLKIHWIKDKDSWLKLQDIFINTLPEDLEIILENSKELNWDLKIDFILRNSYIKGKSRLNYKRFKYRKLNINDFEELTKYRNALDSENPYLSPNENLIGKEYKKYLEDKPNSIIGTKSMSLIDVNPNKSVNWKQKVWKEILIDKMNFFHINNDKWISYEEQLLINRIFSPFFPMARLIKLKNWKTEYVSINVEEIKTERNQSSWKEICWFKESTPEEIKKYFRLIYQFLASDFDRTKINNISDDWIIYDFDDIFNRKRKNTDIFKNTFNDQQFHNEFSKIFYIIKNYIHNYCIEEINRLTEKLKSTLDENKKDKIIIKIELLKKLLNREAQFTLTNLISFIKIKDEKILNFATESDNKNYI